MNFVRTKKGKAAVLAMLIAIAAVATAYFAMSGGQADGGSTPSRARQDSNAVAGRTAGEESKPAGETGTAAAPGAAPAGVGSSLNHQAGSGQQEQAGPQTQPQPQPQPTELPLQIAAVTVSQGNDFDGAYSHNLPVRVSVHIPLWLPVGDQAVPVQQPSEVYVTFQNNNGPMQKYFLGHWKNDQGHSWFYLDMNLPPGQYGSLTAFAILGGVEASLPGGGFSVS